MLTSLRSSSGTRFAALLGIACIGLAAAGCSSSSSSSSSAAAAPSTAAAASGSPSASATGSGPVDVLYAGSLVDLMQNQLGPAFEKATGYSVTGFSAGSKALATEIKGKVHEGDVFISASPKVNATLMGPKNGSWVSWYAEYATSALVLGYNPNSKFAAALKSKPWYEVLAEPGLRLGFTDPATDPKGELSAEALKEIAASKNLPALKAMASDQADVFPEETLVGRLQSGQLDAGFFYTVEARNAGLRTVSLSPVYKYALYTVTILDGARHRAAAEAFVRYLLAAGRSHSLGRDGLVAVTPTFSGSAAEAPTRLRRLLGAR